MQLDQADIDALKVNEVGILSRVAEELSIRTSQVSAVITLVGEGCTVPFISRYRKERTGSLDEVQVRDSAALYQTYVNLENRRLEVIRGIFDQGKLTEELFDNIGKCRNLTEIEDIYAPYKRKKKTRGMVAFERGLEGLSKVIVEKDEACVIAEAPKYIRQDAEKPELSVATIEEAIQGAMDIVAETFSQNPENRAFVKSFFMREGSIISKGVGDEEKKAQSTYQMYWEYSEGLSSLKPHRIMALNRGEREGALEVSLNVDIDRASEAVRQRFDLKNRFHSDAIDDGLRRLLAPAVLREIRSNATDNADEHSINVFSQNLRNLLMSPPIKGARVLGVDPGIRTGTKCAALDETGKFIGYFVINQERDPDGARKAIAEAIKKYDIKLVAVGNGTASQDVQAAVVDALAESGGERLYTVVDEDGASVYSASDTAREEFPELDLTIRGAISIGRRLQDPLAELVKIDPKSIGVGLYQHDVNQKRLSDSLDDVVGSVVNRVGVNINTASHSLLKYVSGINAGLAKKIVKYREENGKILGRDKLLAIPGMGAKSFEQCAGFLKIPESNNPLDNTWVHPENYALASEILPIVRGGADPDRATREALKAKYEIGDATLDDIIMELKKPNRDPREDFPKPVLQQGLVRFEDLAEGLVVKGKVKNVVDFGAFVDIGIKESALIHVSEMSDRFVDDPMDLLKVGDVKDFRIISLDQVRRRIGLSLKTDRGQGPIRQSRTSAEGTSRMEAEGDKPRRALVVKRQDGGKSGTPTAQPKSRYDGIERGNAAGNHGQDRGKPPREDDGMTYNPFADLLKKKH